MKFWDFVKEGLSGGSPALHPLDRKMAKRWVKERLKRLYPELRADPKALERAYQELGIDPRPGEGKGGTTAFEITLPNETR